MQSRIHFIVLENYNLKFPTLLSLIQLFITIPTQLTFLQLKLYGKFYTNENYTITKNNINKPKIF